MRKIALLAVTAIATTLIGASASAQVSYRAVCQPGAGMSASVGIGNLQLTFVRGATGAAGGVTPGTCTWLDRGIGAGEPNNMTVSGNSGFARYIADAVFAGSTFYVDMYNNGAGRMIVTRIGL